MAPKGKTIAVVAGGVVVVVLSTTAWLYRGRLKAWYRFWQQFESIGRNEQGVVVDLVFWSGRDLLR